MDPGHSGREYIVCGRQKDNRGFQSLQNKRGFVERIDGANQLALPSGMIWLLDSPHSTYKALGKEEEGRQLL